MNAIEIHGLTKSFRGLYALDGLNMTVPQGAIYGFIGENGSGKSTTQKLICGHLVPDKGEILLFGKPYTDAGVRARVGALIENAGCFPNSSIKSNLMMQAINLGISDRSGEIDRVLKIVRMDGEKKLAFKKCSLGMKQRAGIAMALLGDPALLILDEPINGLDADGMRIMREVLTDITKEYGCTVLISSHILGELEKIATHYGIIRQGKMVKELSAADMESRAKVCIKLKCQDMERAFCLLKKIYPETQLNEGYIWVYGENQPQRTAKYLMDNRLFLSYIKTNKLGLEDYYADVMALKESV